MTEERRVSDPAAVRVTERALDALRSEGIEPSRSVLVIRYVLGCGGSGFRTVVEPAGGLEICLDDTTRSRLTGAAIDYDGKENEGFFLDHPDAASAAFC